MSADQPTAQRPRGEIDAFELQMDSQARLWAQTKSSQSQRAHWPVLRSTLHWPPGLPRST